MDDRRWIWEAIGTECFERLASGLGGSELWSVLLEVLERRARARTPSEVLAQYGRDAFCRPAPINQRVLNALDGLLFSATRAFEALELSPVAPLGVCSVVAATDQRRVLSALRGTEVLADPTNVLALECAERLRDDPTAPVHLCTSERVLRAQPVPRERGFTQHFRLFALASGGVEEKDHAFSVRAVTLHARSLLGALDALEREGYAFGARRVQLLATEPRRPLAERIARELGANARVTLGMLEHAYYSGGVRYQVWCTPPGAGTELPIADGGTFDWLARLTSNRRAVLVGSGLGSQLIATRFRAEALEVGGVYA